MGFLTDQFYDPWEILSSLPFFHFISGLRKSAIYPVGLQQAYLHWGFKINLLIFPLGAMAIEEKGLPSDCSRSLAYRGERSSSQIRDDVWSAYWIHAVVGYLDWNYRYESVATQIPQDIVLETIPYTGRKFLFHQGSNQCHICAMWQRLIY